jgi:hypothetical protein
MAIEPHHKLGSEKLAIFPSKTMMPDGYFARNLIIQ